MEKTCGDLDESRNKGKKTEGNKVTRNGKTVRAKRVKKSQAGPLTAGGGAKKSHQKNLGSSMEGGRRNDTKSKKCK